MRLLPDYTILIAYLFGAIVPVYAFSAASGATGGKLGLYGKGLVLLLGYFLIHAILGFAGQGLGAEGFQALPTCTGDNLKNCKPADSKGTGSSSGATSPTCPDCGKALACPVHKEIQVAICPPQPDMSKYVLKSSIPPCPSLPDLANYMLKSECPPVPDMSQYVLKSSVPKQGPIIIDTSADNKSKCGDCPPCPRPRCPEVICPPAPKCPAPAPCPRPVCPEPVVKCKAESAAPSSRVRPFLAPLDFNGFG
jgi:hypothetical protein